MSEQEVRDLRHAQGIRPVFKRVDTCAAEFASSTAYLYSTYEEECEAAPTRPQEGHGPGWRAQPHRPGDRVRLLLRPCRLCPARGRLRDHHGQLQPGDRLHRLRHLRPALFRAPDPGGRAGDRPHGAALRGHRPVRGSDPVEAGARPGGGRGAHHRDQPGVHRPGRGPRALPADRQPARAAPAAQHHGPQRGRGGGPGGHHRLSAGGAPVLCPGRAGHGDRLRGGRPQSLHAPRGAGLQRLPGPARPLPRRRHRGGRGRHLRRDRRADRRHHGAHRAGRGALRGLGLLLAALHPVAVPAGPHARADDQARPCPQGGRADERPVRHQGRRYLHPGGQPARLAHRALRLQGHRAAAGQGGGALHGRGVAGGRRAAPRSARPSTTSSRRRSSPSSSSPGWTRSWGRR